MAEIETINGNPIVAEVASESIQPSVDAWLAAHPEATTTVEDGSVTDAKLVQTGGVLSAVYSQTALVFEQGTLNSTNGASSPSNTRVRSPQMLSCDSVIAICSNSNFMVNMFWYPADTSQYLGTTGFLSDTRIDIQSTKPDNAVFFKIAVRYASGTTVAITPEDVTSSDVYAMSSYVLDIQNEIYQMKNPVPFTTEIQSVCKIEKSWDISSSGSGACFATKNGTTQLWSFVASDDGNQNLNGYYRREYNVETSEFGSTTTLGMHSLGHVNACSYNEEKDSFICGNGSSDYTLSGKIYIVENAFNKTDLLIEDALVIEFAGYGTKVNAIWGDDNDGGNNVIFVITNDGYDIYRILLGEDDAELEAGTLQKTTGFNGTYKVLGHWEYGSLKKDYPNVVQGAFYYDDRVFWGFGHFKGAIPIHWARLLNGDVETGGIDYMSYDASGAEVTRLICSVANIGSKAFCIFADKTYMVDIS